VENKYRARCLRFAIRVGLDQAAGERPVARLPDVLTVRALLAHLKGDPLRS
jgi:hypothetical protein